MDIKRKTLIRLFVMMIILTVIPWIGSNSSVKAVTQLTSIALTVEEPVEGKVFTAGKHITGLETETCTYSLSWCERFIGEWASSPYERGKDYIAVFMVQPKSGYVIGNINKVNITVNGDSNLASEVCYNDIHNAWQISYKFHIQGSYMDVTFSPNGGSGTMDKISVEENNYLVLPECSFTAPENKAFGKWTNGNKEYAPGEEAYITKATTFTANWIDDIDYTVTFDNKGHGIKPKTQTLKANSLVTEPSISEEGWKFAGWYTDEDPLNFGWNFSSDKVKGNITLYARWNKILDDAVGIDITVERPEAGKEFPYPDYITGLETETCVYQMSWSEGTVGQWAYGTCEKGKDYFAVFQARPKDGYLIEDINKVKITVNGDSNLAEKAWYNNNNSAWQFAYLFRCLPDDCMTLAEDSFDCTGSEIKPAPVVKYNDVVLVEGKDYTVSYSNNIKPGTASVTITGINNYIGTETKTFEITGAMPTQTPTSTPTSAPTATAVPTATTAPAATATATPTAAPTAAATATPTAAAEVSATPAATATPTPADATTPADDGTILTDADGSKYYVADKVTSSQLAKNLAVADKTTGGKYKITAITRKGKKITGGTVSFIKPYDSKAAVVNVADTVKIAGIKFKVTEIAKNACKGNKAIKKVTIGKSVKKIGANAFNGCTNLKSIKIKTAKLTKKTVGKNAFKNINKKAVAGVPKSKRKLYKQVLKAKGMKAKTQKIK